jgi:hypothetical protein
VKNLNLTWWQRLVRMKRRFFGQCACPWCECPALPAGDKINRCDHCGDHAS